MRLTRTTPINTLTNGVTVGGKSAAITAPETYTCTTYTTSSSDNHSREDDHYVMSQDVAERLVWRTEQKVHDFLEKSQWVKNHSSLSEIPRFDAADFVMGKHLAEGGFSNIHEIVSFNKVNPLEEEDHDDPANSVNDNNNNNNNKTKKRYVVKHLKPQLALNPYKLRSAAKDICNEIHVLSSLNHEHIVQVKGLSSAGISGFAATCRADSFFLVMERLDQSLLHKISQWRQRGIMKQALSLSNLGKSEPTLKLFQERIRAAQQLTNALVYLHERRILHRDVKPGNIAFDADGNVKLIDFGLAVELPAPVEGDVDNDPDAATYDLGNAGTMRYQAPEVIKKEPYNAKAETYSVCIVLWEIMSLTKPFERLSCEEVKQSVTQVGCRPRIHRSWPRPLRVLLKKGWSQQMKRRPSMMDMEQALKCIAQHDYSKRSFPFFG